MKKSVFIWESTFTSCWLVPANLLIAGVATKSPKLILVGVGVTFLMNWLSYSRENFYWKPRARQIAALMIVPFFLFAWFNIEVPERESSLIIELLFGYSAVALVTELSLRFRSAS